MSTSSMISASTVEESDASASRAASVRPRRVPDRYDAIIVRTSSGGRAWSTPLAVTGASVSKGRGCAGTAGTTVDGCGVGDTGTGEIGAGGRGDAVSLCRNGRPDGVSVVGSSRRPVHLVQTPDKSCEHSGQDGMPTNQAM